MSITTGEAQVAAVTTPSTSGGLVIYRNLDLDETGISVKATPGQVYGGVIYNASTSVRYLKFYNKATAPTVGSDTPVLTAVLPPESAFILGVFSGAAFALGIGIGATTGLADNDTGAPSANDVIINLLYK